MAEPNQISVADTRQVALLIQKCLQAHLAAGVDEKDLARVSRINKNIAAVLDGRPQPKKRTPEERQAIDLKYLTAHSARLESQFAKAFIAKATDGNVIQLDAYRQK